ncbi:MAG: DCC1-like thiol-disulfide oxidoreductase family protein [Planctomycetota bacterium]|nr:DCC1-like thiol-disulfide oxidoreductase family protein [Planctomycetota bacterium]MEC8512098.1 DCC1-like thiol-disulfide oxidoreductase family protein [Planctomycetota bacterium]
MDAPPNEAAAALRPLLLYDGECGLCARSVRFVLAKERGPELCFAPLQSDVGRAVLARHGLDEDLSTVVYVDAEDRVHLRSGAALRVAGKLRRPWSWARAMLVVPAFLRDAVYRVIARYRMGIFGGAEACRLPRPDEAERFLV